MLVRASLKDACKSIFFSFLLLFFFLVAFVLSCCFCSFLLLLFFSVIILIYLLEYIFMLFLKKLRKKIGGNLFIFLIFLVLLVIPVIVIGIDNQDTGYSIGRNTSKILSGLTNAGDTIDKRCIINNDASRDFFIPTKSANEWLKFKLNKPTSVTVYDSCCGDDVCNGSETCTTCATDCGACPACYSSGDCGSVGSEWSGTWVCSGQTIRGYKYSYSCVSGNCVLNSTLTDYKVCGGGENSRCLSGNFACQSYCSDWSDNDGDSYIDGKDTDCGGCGGLECTWYGQSSCSETSNCFINGVTNAIGQVSVSNTWQCPYGGTFYAAFGGSCGSSCYYSNPAGAYVSVSSSYNCSNGFGVNLIVCPEGSYNPPGGGASCSVCPLGTHSNGTGANSCTQCAAGYYCPRGVQIPCPSGSTSNPGAASCYTTGT